MGIDVRDGWELAGAETTMPPGQYGSDTRWIKTQMPRPVHYALMEAGEVPNLWYGENFKSAMDPEAGLVLRRRCVIPEAWRDAVVRLRFDGWIIWEWFGWTVKSWRHQGSFGGPTIDICRVTPGKEQELLVRLVHEPHDLLPNYDTSSENRNPRVVKPDAQDGKVISRGNRYRPSSSINPFGSSRAVSPTWRLHSYEPMRLLRFGHIVGTSDVDQHRNGNLRRHHWCADC